jgi:hypothetical protein
MKFDFLHSIDTEEIEDAAHRYGKKRGKQKRHDKKTYTVPIPRELTPECLKLLYKYAWRRGEEEGRILVLMYVT